MEDIVEIGNFADYFEVTLAKEILESNGIKCIITGVNLNMLAINSEEKIKLLVNKNDTEKGLELLTSFFNK